MSDWSSDLCSSGLARLAVAKTAHRRSGDDASDADPRADGDIGPARQPLRAAPQPFGNGRAIGVRVERERLSPGQIGKEGLVPAGLWRVDDPPIAGRGGIEIERAEARYAKRPMIPLAENRANCGQPLGGGGGG